MPSCPEEGITEEQLRIELGKYLEEINIAKDAHEVYRDITRDGEEADKLGISLSQQAMEILTGNMTEYIAKTQDIIDAQTRALVIYNLYKENFPDSPLFANPEYRKIFQRLEGIANVQKTLHQQQREIIDHFVKRAISKSYRK